MVIEYIRSNGFQGHHFPVRFGYAGKGISSYKCEFEVS
jgi:hypothetical protein